MHGALLAEIIGTALLVSVGITPIALGAPMWVVALSFGIGLAVPVAAFGRLSGGHFNPAVSFGMWLEGNLTTVRLLPYTFAQIAGAFIGLWLVSFAQSTLAPTSLGMAQPIDGVNWLGLLLIELSGTFLLVLTILVVTADKAPEVLAPFTIGGALGMAILVLGGLTGGSFNPARYMGPVLVTGTWPVWWELALYLVAPYLGAGAAVAANHVVKQATPK